jgi:hypothetical protein
MKLFTTNVKYGLVGLLLFALCGPLLVQANKTIRDIPQKDYVLVEADYVSNDELCRVYGATPEAQAEVDKTPTWRQGAALRPISTAASRTIIALNYSGKARLASRL